MTTAESAQNPALEQPEFTEPHIPSMEARKLAFDLQYVFDKVPMLDKTEGNIRTIAEALAAISRY